MHQTPYKLISLYFSFCIYSKNHLTLYEIQKIIQNNNITLYSLTKLLRDFFQEKKLLRT